MRVSILLAHPNIKSFNHAIASEIIQTLKDNDQSYCFHDLYEEKFNPILPYEEFPKGAKTAPQIEQHCNELAQADSIIVIHPNWWGQPPAILKGWVDRVMRPGTAYEFLDGDEGEGIPIGLLKAKTAIIYNTSNTNTERENKIFGDPLERIWKDCIFNLCGVVKFHRRMFNIVVTSTQEEREQWLNLVRQDINEMINNM